MFVLSAEVGCFYSAHVDDLFSSPITASTRYCAVYGQPIRHSASPAMHNPALAELGLDWRYLAFEVAPDELGQAIAGAKAMRYIGLNLTVPHKLLALDMVDVLDESAETWGAVNTICFETEGDGGKWTPLGQALGQAHGEVRAKGYNTDADGITLALQQDLGLNLAGLKVLFLGAGGAGRVAALKLAKEGVAELHLVNRTETKAVDLANEIRDRFPSTAVSVGYPDNASGNVDLVLNATSLGLKEGDSLPIDENQFKLTLVVEKQIGEETRRFNITVDEVIQDEEEAKEIAENRLRRRTGLMNSLNFSIGDVEIVDVEQTNDRKK